MVLFCVTLSVRVKLRLLLEEAHDLLLQTLLLGKAHGRHPDEAFKKDTEKQRETFRLLRRDKKRAFLETEKDRESETLCFEARETLSLNLH